MKTRRETEERVIACLFAFDEMASAHYRKMGWMEDGNGDRVKRSVTDPTFGPKYARLVRESSAIGFVNLTNGDILYAAGWAGPGAAPRVRGNIWAQDFGLSAFRWHGVARADEMRKP